MRCLWTACPLHKVCLLSSFQGAHVVTVLLATNVYDGMCKEALQQIYSTQTYYLRTDKVFTQYLHAFPAHTKALNLNPPQYLHPRARKTSIPCPHS